MSTIQLLIDGDKRMSGPEPSRINNDPRTYDPWGRKCLEWYKGIFDCVYFAFHPFVSIPGLDVRSCFLNDEVPAVMTLEQKNAIAQRRLQFFAKKPKRETVELMEKRSGQPIGWKTVCDACGLSSYADLAREEQGRIGALRDEFRNVAFQDAVWQYCLGNNIFPPLEDSIPPIAELPIAKLINKLNFSHVVLSDQFGDCAREVAVGELLDPETPWRHLVNFEVTKLYPTDNSLLFVVGFDSVVTKICANRAFLDGINLEDCFEGFWCTEETDDGWWLTPEERRICEEREKAPKAKET